MNVNQSRRGFTLVEILVVIAIIGMLIALLLPAVQSARESARKITCTSQIREVGRAAILYAEQHRRLPPLWMGDMVNPWENFSWRVAVLPHLEYTNLQDEIELSQSPLAAVNQSAVQTRIPIFECPSTYGRGRSISQLGPAENTTSGLQLAATDYVAVHDVSTPEREFPLRGLWNGGPELEWDDGVAGVDLPQDRFSAALRIMHPKFAGCRDGLSKTAMLIEQAGKPQGYAAGFQVFDHAPTEGAWATCEYGSFSGEGLNINNYTDGYSFHTSVITAFGDNSVHGLHTGIEPRVLIALLSRDGNEIVDTRDWEK